MTPSPDLAFHLLERALRVLNRVADRDVHGMDIRGLREEAGTEVSAICAALALGRIQENGR